MFDGIKILDLSVSADALLTHDRLLFPLSLDKQTGAVLDRPRRANDQGLTFTLTPTLTGDRLRCELQGSLHRYGRGGLHNADQFTAADLLAALNQLMTTYGIDPFTSRLNNVEFGVNVSLPFPVGQVLGNLISYKYRPFVREPGDGFAYYQAVTQRYIVKLYDKGDQYGLPGNVLRVEVKVLKMEYLRSKGIQLDTLADLLLTGNYGTLGALLVDTFTEILFDEPTINPAALTIKERSVYQNGRNPRFWSIPDDLTGKEYNAHRQQLHRAEKTFRALLHQHRHGDNWQSLTAALIGQTWERLSTVDDDLLLLIDQRRAAWRAVEKCHKLTGSAGPDQSEKCPLLTGYVAEQVNEECHKLTGLTEPGAGRGTLEKCYKLTGPDSESPEGEMSQINPLSIALICDIERSQQVVVSAVRGTPANEVNRGPSNEEFFESIKRDEPTIEQVAGPPDQPARSCPVTGLDITHQPISTRFLSASTLRCWYDLDRPTFDTLAGRFLTTKQAGADLDKQCESIAHNIRNTFTNPRNNPVRRLKKYGTVL